VWGFLFWGVVLLVGFWGFGKFGYTQCTESWGVPIGQLNVQRDSRLEKKTITLKLSQSNSPKGEPTLREKGSGGVSMEGICVKK